MHETIPGSDVLQQLEAGYQSLCDEAERITDRLRQIEDAGRDNLRRRGDTLVDLAKFYLPDLQRDTIETTFREMRSELRELLIDKQQQQRSLQQQWDTARDTQQRAEAELNQITHQLDTLVARREDLEQQLAERLSSEEPFQQVSSQAVATEQRLARFDQQVAESREMAADKLPQAQSSRLYQYLTKRKYGTPQYKASLLTTSLDRWVARLIEFDQLQAGCQFLTDTPKLLQAEVQRTGEQFASLMTQLNTIEQQVSTELGLSDVLTQGVTVGAQRAAAIEQLEEIERLQEKIDDSLREFDASQDALHQEAIQRMKQFLGSMRESALETHARATPEPEDDQLMEEIRWLNDRLDEARAESEELHPQLAATRRCQRELGELLRQFRRAEFDSQRCLFSTDLDTASRVQRFIEGKMPIEQLWDELESQQHFAPTWAEREWGERARDASYYDHSSEFTYVLMHVLTEAAGAAYRTAAGHFARKYEQLEETTGQWSQPPTNSDSAWKGFTHGDGF